jgi:protein SCO1/2
MLPLLRVGSLTQSLVLSVFSALASGHLSGPPPAAHAAVPTPRDRAPEPRQRSAKDYQPNTPLVSHKGQTLRFYEDVIKGRIVLINTMFTSCAGICPPITNNLISVQRALAPYLGKQVLMVSITVDPQTDTPAVLKAYVERFGIGPGWLFLTGKQADVDSVLAKLGDTDPEKNRHSGMLLIGDDPGKSWRKVPAMSSPQDIVGAVEKLLTRPQAPSEPRAKD